MTENAAAVGTSTVVNAIHEPAWKMSAGIQMAVVLGLVIATIGTITSRVDVVLLAVPLLVSAGIGIDRRPRADSAELLAGTAGRAPAAGLRIEVTRLSGTGGSSEFAYGVAIKAPLCTELVHLRVAPQGSHAFDLILAPQDAETVRGRLPVVHSGRQRVVEVTYRLVSVNGGWQSTPTPKEVAERVVDPSIVEIASLPLPHRLTGLAGTHGSVRPGDGGEFRDLHPYAAGDRLRRIDWKATARRSQGFGDLYVRRTDATSDATVVIVLDGRDEIGERVEHWSADSTEVGGLNSMDLAREAAASLAMAAIGEGDRVSLIDLAIHDGLVPAGGGKRHLDRLLRRIAVSGPSGIRLSRRRAPIVPVGSIVYLLSTFLDDDATSMALLWRAKGHRVIAIDTLPAPLVDGSAAYTRIAHRLLMAERRRRIAELRANGVELFAWQEDSDRPSRAIAMRTLARAGRRRR